MEFKAKAKKAARCAYAPCATPAQKIYEDEKWRVLACSEAHANLARNEIDKVPLELQGEYFK